MSVENLVVRLLNRVVSPRRPAAVPGILLGHGTAHGAPFPVTLPPERRTEHAVVVGKSGSGKTHFLLHLAVEHMRRGEGFVFFDYHGDAARALAGLAAAVPGALDRLVVMAPTDRESSPALNPLELRRGSHDQAFGQASEVSAILRSRWGVDAFGARTEELVRNTLYTLATHGLTLVEVPLFLTSSRWRRSLTERLPSADVRSYWAERFEPLSEPMKAAFREPFLNKVTGFLTVPSIRHVLGQPVSTVRFDEHMRQGDYVVVDLAKGQLREHAQTLGNLVFAKLQFDVLARAALPPSERRLFTIMCDEVQNLAHNDLATLLAEGRKFGVSVITANQFWDQLPAGLRGALLAAGTQAFFRLSASDAGALGAELGRPGRQTTQQLTQLARGSAFVRVGGGPPVLMTVPPLPRTKESGGAYASGVGRCSRPRVEVERDIDRRRLTAVQQDAAAPSPAPLATNGQEGQHEW